MISRLFLFLVYRSCSRLYPIGSARRLFVVVLRVCVYTMIMHGGLFLIAALSPLPLHSFKAREECFEMELASLWSNKLSRERNVRGKGARGRVESIESPFCAQKRRGYAEHDEHKGTRYR